MEQEQCQGKDCTHTAMFECSWCHKMFCLLHILNLNEDGKYGNDPLFVCSDCAPWNVYGMLEEE